MVLSKLGGVDIIFFILLFCCRHIIPRSWADWPSQWAVCSGIRWLSFSVSWISHGYLPSFSSSRAWSHQQLWRCCADVGWRCCCFQSWSELCLCWSCRLHSGCLELCGANEWKHFVYSHKQEKMPEFELLKGEQVSHRHSMPLAMSSTFGWMLQELQVSRCHVVPGLYFTSQTTASY